MAATGGILPLALREVRFSAGGRTIIDGVSAEIEAGPATIILGANGAGKSVLMRLMHGLLRPTSGTISWREQDAERVRRGQAIPAQSIVGPQVWGYDPEFRSEMGEFSRAKAQALLDLNGYVDRNGDGWRDLPDGSPLVIEYATQPDDLNRQIITQWKKNMDAIGIRIVFRTAQWPENQKAARVGKLMMWGLGWTAGPDGDGFLELGYSQSKGQSNYARFDLPEYDRLFELQRRLPDGPERMQVMAKMKELTVAYMPYKAHVHRIWTDLAQPWVIGYHRNVFLRDFWRYVDVDPIDKARRLN